MRERPGPSWPSFSFGLLVLVALLVTAMYRAEQRHLTETRDMCLAAADTEYQKDSCIREYEINSGWF
jgi:hypothetical protein